MFDVDEIRKEFPILEKKIHGKKLCYLDNGASAQKPRKVLEEFGLKIDSNKIIKVWDSTSELRYLVLPQRPNNTERLNEEELSKLVTRNSMIGTGLPKVYK